MHHLHLIAGLAWNPGIKGILVVSTAVAILMGSIYLLLATNTGARLGLLIAFAGLFGWLSILSMIWWIQPPGNGPRGASPVWRPVEIYVDGGGTPKTPAVEALPAPAQMPSAQQIIADHPDIAKNYPNPDTATLSDIQASDPAVLKEVVSKDALGGWKITPSSSAGEAQSVADVALTTGTNFFKATTDYKKLSMFEVGGKQTRTDYCPSEKRPHDLIPDDIICRIQYKIYKASTWKHSTHYAVVQVQQVIPQVAKAGEAPPIPVVDPTKPVVSVVLVRDLGTVRLLPAVFFVISFALFVFFVLVLHYRDKTLQRNLAAAEA